MRHQRATRGDIEAQAPGQYRYANVGDVWKRTGAFWSLCPRYFYAFADPEATVTARRVLKLARARRAEDPDAAREGALTPAGLEWLELGHRFWGELELERLEQEREQRRADLERNANGGSRWDGARPRRRGRR